MVQCPVIFLYVDKSPLNLLVLLIKTFVVLSFELFYLALLSSGRSGVSLRVYIQQQRWIDVWISPSVAHSNSFMRTRRNQHITCVRVFHVVRKREILPVTLKAESAREYGAEVCWVVTNCVWVICSWWVVGAQHLRGLFWDELYCALCVIISCKVKINGTIVVINVNSHLNNW